MTHYTSHTNGERTEGALDGSWLRLANVPVWRAEREAPVERISILWGQLSAYCACTMRRALLSLGRTVLNRTGPVSLELRV